jgi:pimeloyl-ACP methyl ester carboxylesterase
MTAHPGLLRPLGTGGGRALDAVIVPTARSAEHLRAAAAIARETDSELLVLCSLKAKAATAERVVAHERVARHHLIDIPDAYRCALLPSRPPSNLAASASRPALSHKRNLGLLVARMVGWRTALFLDDDIALDGSGVEAALRGLDGAAAVGFPVVDWPDNSVVGHANRASGAEQDVFVGPSALLVDMRSRHFGHFPTIYNEGALYLFDALAAREVRCSDRTARQLPYNPFHDVHRGRDEEFGDVIAEGLMNYLDEPTNPCPLHRSYWRDFLPRRRAFLREVTERLLNGPASPRRASALGAVRSADRQHGLITPAACAHFVQRWRADRDLWVGRLSDVERVRTVPDALRRLGLPVPRPRPRHTVSRLVRPAIAATPPVITPWVRAAPRSETLAVLIPGFLDSRSWAGTRTLAVELQSSGRTAVSFDPRGTFRTPGDPEQIKPSVQVCDTISAIGMVRPHRRTVLIGHSFGASIALLAAAEDPRVTEVVAIMPPRCFVWPRDYDAARDSWRRTKIRRFDVVAPGSSVQWRFKVPHSVVDDAVERNLPATLRKLRHDQRILFIAGRDDTVIPAATVEELSIECHNARKTFVVLPVGHDYRDHPEQLRMVNAAVLHWLDTADASDVVAFSSTPAPRWRTGDRLPA